MPRLARTVGLAAAIGLLAGSVSAQVRFELRDGLVYLSAVDASAAQVLQAWATEGDVRILHAEGLSTDPLTIVLDGVPERRALDEVLSSVPGYVARERAAGVRGKSRYAVLLVLSETQVREGVTAEQAFDEALAQAPAGDVSTAERIVDSRDLPPPAPGSPNGPVGLTPAHPSQAAPPPLAFGADDAAALTAAGRDPGVNPIPLDVPPPTRSPDAGASRSEDPVPPVDPSRR